jgi:hypothetical protein
MDISELTRDEQFRLLDQLWEHRPRRDGPAVDRRAAPRA